MPLSIPSHLPIIWYPCHDILCKFYNFATTNCSPSDSFKSRAKNFESQRGPAPGATPYPLKRCNPQYPGYFSYYAVVSSSSFSWLSWLMKRKERTMTNAPTQYNPLEYCELIIICPTKDRGIVNDSPTVTTSGVVRSIAYAHE